MTPIHEFSSPVLINMHIRNSVGRRKTSVANLILSPGCGYIFVGGILTDELFIGLPRRILVVHSPFRILPSVCFNANAKIRGGGLLSQAKALQLALSRSLLQIQPILHEFFRRNYYITCDSRIKERRKYGIKKSRKTSQFSKR